MTTISFKFGENKLTIEADSISIDTYVTIAKMCLEKARERMENKAVDFTGEARALYEDMSHILDQVDADLDDLDSMADRCLSDFYYDTDKD